MKQLCFLLLSLVIISSCNDGVSKPADQDQPPSIVGKWVSGLTELEFKDNGTYNVIYLKNSESDADFEALRNGTIDHLPQTETLRETSTYTINNQTIVLQGHSQDFKTLRIEGDELTAYSIEMNAKVVFTRKTP